MDCKTLPPTCGNPIFAIIIAIASRSRYENNNICMKIFSCACQKWRNVLIAYKFEHKSILHRQTQNRMLQKLKFMIVMEKEISIQQYANSKVSHMLFITQNTSHWICWWGFFKDEASFSYISIVRYHRTLDNHLIKWCVSF